MYLIWAHKIISDIQYVLSWKGKEKLVQGHQLTTSVHQQTSILIVAHAMQPEEWMNTQNRRMNRAKAWTDRIEEWTGQNEQDTHHYEQGSVLG